ncbi:lysosome membrane protein 2 [Caerostris extrusa]|uniref:Lysosome membrane protein 2 n=1 Tax=Caerostris extrusa TaxID=172846 RepID=A0AAV4SJL6_CAEEX|nr:lysosome membrane protein 2 [Caerostris extrusa]
MVVTVIPFKIYQSISISASEVLELDEYGNKGAKPILQELGPYVFKGHWMKDDIEWDDSDGTVTYRDIKEYTFCSRTFCWRSRGDGVYPEWASIGCNQLR